MAKSFDNVKHCLSQIDNAFFWKKPAIITSHRLNYIVSITGADNINADFTINLPEIVDGPAGNRGRQYIISKDFVGSGRVLIQPFAGETVDDEASFYLDIFRQRIRLTSTGDDSWMVI